MKRSDVIMALAPHMTHGFDFSHPDQYQQWCDKTAMAAEPFVKLIADEEIAHRAALEKIAKLEAELKALKEAAK